MKANKTSYIFILQLLLSTTNIQSSGFIPGTPIKMVVHNHVIVISIPYLVARVAPIAKTILTAVGTYLGVHFAKKAAHKHHADDKNSYSSSTDSGSYYPDPNDPNDDRNKTKNDEHPHGIYKDAPYHHKNSGDYKKSPCIMNPIN